VFFNSHRCKTLEMLVNLFGKSFRHGCFAKVILMVFLNSPYRKKKQEKKVGWWVGGSGI
jgi:hypothetical protein